MYSKIIPGHTKSWNCKTSCIIFKNKHYLCYYDFIETRNKHHKFHISSGILGFITLALTTYLSSITYKSYAVENSTLSQLGVPENNAGFFIFDIGLMIFGFLECIYFSYIVGTSLRIDTRGRVVYILFCISFLLLTLAGIFSSGVMKPYHIGCILASIAVFTATFLYYTYRLLKSKHPIGILNVVVIAVLAPFLVFFYRGISKAGLLEIFTLIALFAWTMITAAFPKLVIGKNEKEWAHLINTSSPTPTQK